MSRTPFRHFLSSLRSSARANLTAATRSPCTALTRRMMSSESHASHGSTASDRPWMIGSALVFGPLFLYLVSPAARQGSYGHGNTDHGHKTHHDEHHEDKHVQHAGSHREEAQPIADDQGTVVTGQEVKESMEKAFEADSPKDAQEREEMVAEAEMTASDDSAPGAHPEAGSPAEATPALEPEPNPTPTVAVEDANATPATTDEKVYGTPEEAREPAAESKA